MRDYQAFKKSAVGYWERRRIFYNLALIIPALFGYIPLASGMAELRDQRHLSTSIVILLFLISALGANICYSFAYALEFLFGNDDPESHWLRVWRPFLFILGTFLAILLAVVGGRNIAFMEYSVR